MAGRRTVLILDEEESACENLLTHMARFRDWCDIEVYHGWLDAQAVLTHRPPDLILMDPRLPDCNGMELIPSLTAENPETSVVVMLPQGMKALGRKALEAGAVEVMMKPCQASQIEETIARCLGIRYGLRGDLDGVGLSDLVQLIHSKKWDRTLRIVSAENKEGRIYFLRGEILHAETEDLAGNEAFNAILEWPQGRFEIQTGCQTNRRTVEIPTMQVLIDGLRKSDEGSRDLNAAMLEDADEIGALFDSIVMDGPVAAEADHGADTGAMAPPQPSDLPPEAPSFQRRIERLLRGLHKKWDLADACSIVDERGFVLAGEKESGIPDLFWSQLFGATSAFFDDSASLHKRGLFQEALLVGDQGGLVVLTIPRTSCFLVATLKPGTRLGLVLAGLQASLDDISSALMELQS